MPKAHEDKRATTLFNAAEPTCRDAVEAVRYQLRLVGLLLEADRDITATIYRQPDGQWMAQMVWCQGD